MSNFSSSERAMWGREIESEHGAREQLRSGVTPLRSGFCKSPCGYTYVLAISTNSRQNGEPVDRLGMNLPVHLYWRFQYVQYETACWFDYCTVHLPLKTNKQMADNLMTVIPYPIKSSAIDGAGTWWLVCWSPDKESTCRFQPSQGSLTFPMILSPSRAYEYQ